MEAPSPPCGREKNPVLLCGDISVSDALPDFPGRCGDSTEEKPVARRMADTEVGLSPAIGDMGTFQEDTCSAGGSSRRLKEEVDGWWEAALEASGGEPSSDLAEGEGEIATLSLSLAGREGARVTLLLYLAGREGVK